MHHRLLMYSATAYLQVFWIHQAQAFAVRDDSMLVRRDTTSDLVHDSFFIPGVVSSGVVFLVGVLCVLMILLTSSRPDRPLPLTHDHGHDQEIRPVSEVQHNTRPRSYLSRTNTGVTNTSGSGSFYYTRSPRSTSQSIQRKPAPIFQPSPNRTPPGTATLANFPPGPGTSNLGPAGPSSYVHQLRPGVPQHPNLAKYNPEPLIYTPAPPPPTTDLRDPSPKLVAYQWTYPQVQAPPHDPGLRTPQPVPGSPSSMTRVGSGRSEQATDQGTGGYRQGASQNPPSPPSTPPHSQTYQKADQRQLHMATMTDEAGPSAGSYEASTDHHNAYGGIEAEEMGIRTHPSSGEGHAHGQIRMVDQPPGYGDSDPSRKVYPSEKVTLQGG